MKKITTFLLCLTVLSTASFGQVLLSEDFQGATFPPTGWTVLNEDDSTVADPTDDNFIGEWERLQSQNTTPPNFSVLNTSHHDPSGPADDWLITESVTIPNNAGESYLMVFSMATLASTAPANQQGNLDVKISTATNDLADFTTSFDIAPNTTAGAFQTRVLDLTQFAGETIYIAFNDVSENTFGIFLDNISVSTFANDNIALNSLTIASTAADQESVNITGTITNNGAAELTSVDVSWIAGGGTANTATITGINIPAFSIGTFTHPTTLTASNPGNSISVEVTVSNPNGSVDPDDTDNTLTTSVFVNNGTTVTKNTLVEEFATAPCGFCPDGLLQVEAILNTDPNAIAVTHHAGFGTDAMTIPEHSTYASAFVSAAPSATFDRVYFDGDLVGSSDRSVWGPRAATQAAANAPVELIYSGIYNRELNILPVKVTLDFVDYARPGDLRLTLFVVEDSVSNDPNPNSYDAEWDQLNFYYSGQFGANHPYVGVGDAQDANGRWYIKNYEHRYVVRDVVPSSDAWGDNSVITSTPIPQSSFNKTYNIPIDASFDTNNVSIVAVVSYFDADPTKREVLNSYSEKLLDIQFATSIEEVANGVQKLSIYPNPSNNVTNVRFTLSEKNDVELRLRDITGKELRFVDYGNLPVGTQNFDLNVSDLANGIYFVNLKVGDEIISRKISVNK